MARRTTIWLGGTALAALALASLVTVYQLHDLRRMVLGPASRVSVEYVDTEGRVHRIEAGSVLELEVFLRAMEDRFPRRTR